MCLAIGDNTDLWIPRICCHLVLFSSFCLSLHKICADVMRLKPSTIYGGKSDILFQDLCLHRDGKDLPHELVECIFLGDSLSRFLEGCVMWHLGEFEYLPNVA